MKRFLPVIPLLLAALACTLTAPLAPAARATASATPSPTDAHLFQAGTSKPAACIVSTGLANDGRLNLRAGAGTSHEVLSVLHEGDTLTLLASGDWLRVRTADGKAGYVYSRYVECDL